LVQTGYIVVTPQLGTSLTVSFDETGANAITISFSTIYHRRGIEAPSTGVQPGITLANNIIVGLSSFSPDSARCTACSFVNNVIYPQGTLLPGNILMDAKLVDPDNGDLHVKDGSPAIDAASSTGVDHFAMAARPHLRTRAVTVPKSKTATLPPPLATNEADYSYQASSSYAWSSVIHDTPASTLM
jgi:hypothetical protein